MEPRTIRLIGEINEKMYLKLSKGLAKFSSEGDLPVVLELCSEGGFQYDALAIYGKIVTSPVPVYCKVYGKVMSAAGLILAACDYRAAAPGTWFMVHDSWLNGGTDGTQVGLSQNEAEEQQWAELMAKHTKLSAKAWRRYSSQTTYWNIENMLRYGVIDDIIKR